MNMIVHPSKDLQGELTLPGDKSLSHRAALFSALAKGESCIDNFQISGVTQVMLNALTALGVEYHLEGARLEVAGPGWKNLRAPGQALNCGNSATTLRMLAGALAASSLPAVLDGSAGLRRRPMDRIIQPLRRMGVQIEAGEGGGAPLMILERAEGQHLHGMEYTMPAASAQVKSCLLLAGLAASDPVILHEPGPSRDHTERMLANMGCQIEVKAGEGGPTVVLQPAQSDLVPLQMRLPGDISSGSFLIAAALITPESEICLRHVGTNPTRSGILDALRAMGAEIVVEEKGEQAGEPYGDITIRSSKLLGTEVGGELVVRMIDEFPIFAVAACFAQGRTVVKEAGELRYKESDRISALCRELRILGAQVDETADGFIIYGPCKLQGGMVDPHGDHRLAMALGTAGLAAQGPVSIQNAEITHESFPEFWKMLRGLGAQIDMEAEDGR